MICSKDISDKVMSFLVALWCMRCSQVTTALQRGRGCLGMEQPPLPWGLDMKEGERHSTQLLAWAAWAFSRKRSSHPYRVQDEAGIPAILSPILGSAPTWVLGLQLPTPSFPSESFIPRGHPKGQTEPLLDSWTMLSFQ